MIYPYWKINFTANTDVSDKQVGAVISHNNKPIEFLSNILSNPQLEYTMTEKELIAIVE